LNKSQDNLSDVDIDHIQNFEALNRSNGSDDGAMVNNNAAAKAQDDKQGATHDFSSAKLSASK
jgi:hypothetical protein